MTAALVALMLVVRGVVAWLRQQGQLTGELSEDRRRVLAALGGLGLAGLFGEELPPVPPSRREAMLAEASRRAQRSSADYDGQLSDASMVVLSARVFRWFKGEMPSAISSGASWRCEPSATVRERAQSGQVA